MHRLACAFCAIVLACLFTSPAAAQDPVQESPAHIAFVEGVASLERDGQAESAPSSMPLLAGDRVRTDNGRVEILFGDGAALNIDRDSTVDLQSDDVIRLIDGRVRVSIPGPARAVFYRIDTAAGWVEVAEPGEYRVAISRGGRAPEVELAVIRGAARLMNADGETALRAGERALARAELAPSAAYVFNSAAWDSFDRWSEERRRDSVGASAQYLPESVRPYAATFDEHGAWRYEASYGHVWYPSVQVGWRPYFRGRWASFPSFGWTWIGSDAWAWPTHHYGRWGVSAGSWFWIPGRTWSPAWVSWAYAPGYVSWSPLGWDNRPSIGFLAGGIYSRGYDPWSAWTVVPHQRFGVGYVHTNGILGPRLDSRTRGAFVSRQGAPDIRGYAVPRNAAPIYAAGLRRGNGNSQSRPDGGRPAYGAPSADRNRAPDQGGSRPWDAPNRSATDSRRASPADDAAAVFRGRRADGQSNVGRVPMPSAAPRNQGAVGSSGAGLRADTTRERVESRRPVDSVPSYRAGEAYQPRPEQPSRGAAVYRGTAPSAPEPSRSGAPPQRLENPAYRRAPATTRPPSPSSSTQSPEWSAPERSRSPQGYGRGVSRVPSPTMTDRPERSSPDPGAVDRPRAMPRQAPPAAASPSRGGAERRSAPPPPRAESQAPPREAPPQGSGARGSARRR